MMLPSPYFPSALCLMLILLGYSKFDFKRKKDNYQEKCPVARKQILRCYEDFFNSDVASCLESHLFRGEDALR